VWLSSAGLCCRPSPFDYSDCEDFGRWLQSRRQADQDSRRAELTAGIKEAAQHGNLDLAQAQADKLLELDRESENAYRALMEVAYLRGDFTVGIRVWNRCRDMLHQLYGVAPSPTTRELGEMIVAAAHAGKALPSAAGATIPLSVLRPPHFIARKMELKEMLRAWRNGDQICICGEAGIGKSRLLAEFANLVGACVRVAARPGDVVQPYAALSRLVVTAIELCHPPLDSEDSRWLARLLPGMADPIPGASFAPLQTERERTLALQALRRVLGACMQQGCAALILDDLQFADRSTLDALPTLMPPQTGFEPHLHSDAFVPRFVFASRHNEPESPAAILMSAWAGSPNILGIDLTPLTGTEISELLASLDLHGYQSADMAQRLRKQVGGNPAFLLESLKLMLSVGMGDVDDMRIPVAPSIEAVVQRRIALLSAPARHIAQLASVAGGGYSVAMAATALACPVFALTEPLHELEQRQVLIGQQFVHDLVASAVQRSIPAAMAEFMQRFVAGHLEAHHGDPALIAGHWSACGEWRNAGLSFMHAASNAARDNQQRQQAEFLDAAAGCFERCGCDDDLFNALEQRLQVVEVADRVNVRGRLNTRLTALARSEEQQVRALLQRVGFGNEHSKSQGIAELRDGMQRAQALNLLQLAFDFCEPLATQLALQGDLAAAVVLIGQFAPWAESQTDLRLRGRLQRVLGTAHTFCERLQPAIEHSTRAVALFRSAGDDLMRLPAMSNIGLMHHWRGDLHAARAILEEASQLRDRLHGSGASLVIELHLAAVVRDLGEFSNANHRLEQLTAQLRTMTAGSAEPPTDLAIAENHQAQLWLMLGQPTRALDCLRADDAATDLRFRARRVALRLRAARAQGKCEAALLEVAANFPAALTSAFNRAWFELEWFRSLPPDAAALAFAGLHAQAAVVERPALQLQVALRAAQSELASGKPVRALEWVDHVLGTLESLRPFDMSPAEAWFISRDALHANGKLEAAQQASDRGIACVQRTASHLPPEWREIFLRS